MTRLARQRIDFASADAATFNALRDKWRSVAAGCALSKAGLRVASVLPSFVNREYGYAFPSDDDLANSIAAVAKTVKRGLSALDSAGLIDRETKAKRDASGVVIGKARSFYLTLTEGTVSAIPPKGQLPRGQVSPKGQKPSTEGAYGCTNIPDRTTPDIISNREQG